MAQAEVQAVAGGRLLEDIRMTFELVADGRAYEIGPVRVEPLLDHQVDLAEVDKAEVDRDLLGIRRLRAEFMNIVRHWFYHPFAIRMDGIWMSYGRMQGVGRLHRRSSPVGRSPAPSSARPVPSASACTWSRPSHKIRGHLATRTTLRTTTRGLASPTPRDERVLRMRPGNAGRTPKEVGQQFSLTRK